MTDGRDSDGDTFTNCDWRTDRQTHESGYIVCTAGIISEILVVHASIGYSGTRKSQRRGGRGWGSGCRGRRLECVAKCNVYAA